jgi:acyl-CoA reductase-like NAD-dependent aldehyde dehydrogenase
MFRKIFTTTLTVSVLIFCALLTSLPAHALPRVKRDHLTEQEVELVRDAQALDKRTEVFIRAAERRLQAINGATAPAIDAKKAQKEMDKWGPLPKGTRAELMQDFAKILDEAINNIDDVAARDIKNPLVVKSLRKLATAVNNFLPQVNSIRASARDGEELAALEDALDNMQQITEAANRLPAEEKKEKNDKKAKS